MLRRGSRSGDADGRMLSAGPGQIVVFDLARPYDSISTAAETISLRIARAPIVAAAPGVDLHGFTFRGPIGRVLADHMMMLLRRPPATAASGRYVKWRPCSPPATAPTFTGPGCNNTTERHRTFGSSSRRSAPAASSRGGHAYPKTRIHISISCCTKAPLRLLIRSRRVRPLEETHDQSSNAPLRFAGPTGGRAV
jgi:hypothetical protein